STVLINGTKSVSLSLTAWSAISPSASTFPNAPSADTWKVYVPWIRFKVMLHGSEVRAISTASCASTSLPEGSKYTWSGPRNTVRIALATSESRVSGSVDALGGVLESAAEASSADPTTTRAMVGECGSSELQAARSKRLPSALPTNQRDITTS